MCPVGVAMVPDDNPKKLEPMKIAVYNTPVGDQNTGGTATETGTK